MESDMNNAKTTVCHKSEAPAEKMVAFHLKDLPAPYWDIQLMLTCLQGLVNRQAPSLFLAQDDFDERWLEWLVERGDVAQVEWETAEQILDRFAGVAEGIVLVDADVPASINVGTMLGGIRNSLVATPAVAEKFKLAQMVDLYWQARSTCSENI